MGKIKKKYDEAQKKTYLAGEDLRVIKSLAGNDKKVRDKALKFLKKWLERRSAKMPLTQDDFIRLWKGLFYAIWMSDKLLVQEECAEKIANLIHFPTSDKSLMFFKCGLIVMATEWFGIDQLRLDKFLMFIRRLLRQTFVILKKNEWQSELITKFSDILLETILKKDSSTHLGLTMHIIEIYLEELAKVSQGAIRKKAVGELIKPFIKQLSTLKDDRLIAHMRKFLFSHLLDQSDEGIEYHVKFEAWKARGFPGGTIDAMQKVERGDNNVAGDEANEEPLDPRAGCVDVGLPQLPFDAGQISQMLLEHKFVEGSTTKTRKVITKLVEDFNKLSKGTFPLGIKEIRLPEDNGNSTKLKQSVNRLIKFEKKLLSNRKNRKRKLKMDQTNDLKMDQTDYSKKAKIIDESTVTNTKESFNDKLQEFIKQSESGLVDIKSNKKKKLKTLPKLRKRRPKQELPGWAYEDRFRRNSGTWVVHRCDSSDETEPAIQVTQHKNEQIETPKQNGESEPNQEEEKPSTPTQAKGKSSASLLFPCKEWDLLPNKELPHFLLPKKMQKNPARFLGRSSDGLNYLSPSLSKPRIKRFSLDASLVKNPFATNGHATPKSEKKVKIDLKLNKSQDIQEHHAQLQSSPAIPYDANKKPLKPLLKPNTFGSPINPFYKRKLKM